MRKTLLLSSCLLAAACLGGERPGKLAASALWLAAAGEALPNDELAELGRLGVTDLFVPAAELRWSAEVPKLVALELGQPPRGAHVTLVVSGACSAAADPAAAALALAAAVRQLRLEAENRGRVPVGVHFDLEVGVESPAVVLPIYSELLRRLRAELPRDLLLSATLDRLWLADLELAESISEFADSVDFLVAFLYGQRPGEAEDASAWQIDRVMRDVRGLEALDVPYQVGFAVVGVATHLRDGRELERSTEIGLKTLLGSAAIRLDHGFSLESGDRQIYTFQALEAAPLGPWRLERGDTVRVVRTGAPFLQALRARLNALELPRRLGEAYYRAPRAAEPLTPTLRSLAGTLQAAALVPDLRIELESLDEHPAGRSAGPRLRVLLENRNDEGSEISGLDHNYVEVVAEGGTVAAADAGEFSRYELLRAGAARHSVEAIRAPDRVRLYLPVLEGRDRAASGPIVVRGARRVSASAVFLLPDGSVVKTPVVWPPASP